MLVIGAPRRRGRRAHDGVRWRISILSLWNTAASAILHGKERGVRAGVRAWVLRARVMVWPEALKDLGGGQYGAFFRVLPAYVDAANAPGYSPVPCPTVMSWARGIVTLRHIWASPNLVWLAIAAGMYAAFPYDLSPGSVAAAAPISAAFFAERAPLWTLGTSPAASDTDMHSRLRRRRPR